MAEGELHRYRLLGLLLLASNVMAATLIKIIGGSLRGLGTGSFYGEAMTLTLVLAGASTVGTVVLTVVIGSCFWTFYRGGDHNRFVGADFVPSWTDLAIVVALIVTCGMVITAAR